ncbi:MAG: hypothetical protein FWG59_03970 [Betaproteobacteria bacterium]|nr:hypothetical protein [Betaproteobacteria bacterium]
MFLAGAFMLVALFVVLRIVRKGRGRNYEESKKVFEARLQKTGAQTREHTLSVGVAEQMLPIAAAIRELLEFAGWPSGFTVLEEGRTVRLQTPTGEIQIDFGLSRGRVARKHTIGHPQGCWRIRGPGTEHLEYAELSDIVDHLKRIISGI